MGLLESFFGIGKKQLQPVELKPDELEKFISDKTIATEKELEKPVFSKISEIKFLLSEINAHLAALKEKEVSTSEGNIRLRQVVRTSKSTLFIQLSALSKKLEPPKTSNMNEIMDYAFNSAQIIPKEIISARKSIVYTKTILDGEIKEIGKMAGELETCFNGLTKVFENSALFKMQQLKKLAAAVEAGYSDSFLLKKTIGEKKFEANGIVDKKSELLKELAELKSSSQAKEMAEIEAKKEALLQKKTQVKEKFTSMLSEIEKPATRFLNLAGAKKIKLHEGGKETLELFYSDFFQAAKKDPKSVELKKILSQMQKMVEDGTIALKDKDRQMLAIKKILDYDFFGEVFWALNGIEVEHNRLDTQLSTFQVLRQIRSIESQINSLEKEITEKHVQLANMSIKEHSQENNLLTLKENTEKMLSGQFGQQITIKLA